MRLPSELKYILIAMRPPQWVKNAFLFVGLIFSRQLFNVDLLSKVVSGFALFSLGASSIYLFNDIRDMEEDTRHPEKCRRPLPAGKLRIPTAYGASVLLAGTALIGSYLLEPTFSLILVIYLVVNTAYSIAIKRVVILDVMCIAFGFVLRVLAGTTLARVRPSDWLLICTISLALFLGFSKRRHELAVMGAGADNHRKALSDYSVGFLDQMIGIATASAVMSYALYTVAGDTVARFGTRHLVFTIPFVLYGVFRYLYLIHHKQVGGDPTTAVLSDIPLLLNALLWFAAVVIIIY
jgi:4-hydroxybenzoate polyprenyltransferase